MVLLLDVQCVVRLGLLSLQELLQLHHLLFKLVNVSLKSVDLSKFQIPLQILELILLHGKIAFQKLNLSF